MNDISQAESHIRKVARRLKKMAQNLERKQERAQKEVVRAFETAPEMDADELELFLQQL